MGKATKATKATKASSKATAENKTEKGEKADSLKAEKAKKASSKGTVENKTDKGDEADNLKNEKATKSTSKGTVENKAKKASSKATTESIEEKGETEDGAKENNIKNEKSTKAVGPDTVKNMDGKSKKNSHGSDPDPGSEAGASPGSYKPDGTVIRIHDAGTDDVVNENGKHGDISETTTDDDDESCGKGCSTATEETPDGGITADDTISKKYSRTKMQLDASDPVAEPVPVGDSESTSSSTGGSDETGTNTVDSASMSGGILLFSAVGIVALVGYGSWRRSSKASQYTAPSEETNRIFELEEGEEGAHQYQSAAEHEQKDDYGAI